MLGLAMLSAGLALTWSGCSGGDAQGMSAQPRSLVELFSWWLAPGEVEALQALIHVNGVAHPDARVFNAAAVSHVGIEDLIGDRLAKHDPPDLLQLNTRYLRGLHEHYPGSLENLDGLFDSLDLRRLVFPEAVADLMHDGHMTAIPVNVHRENGLFYNKAIFAAHHLSPPATVAEFLAICKTLKAAGVTPVALSHQGWILRTFMTAMAAGTMGSAAFHDYFTGKSAAGLPQLRQAVAIVAEVLANYVNPDAAEEGFGWTHAAQTIYNADAAMFFQGDWAKGYFLQLGWRPGVDFGEVGSPGAADLFLYLNDCFAIPRGAANKQGALDFLATVASPEGQLVFNRLKGSSPIRADVDRAGLDSLGRATLDDLTRARIRMPSPNRPAYEHAMEAFARDRDVDKVMQMFAESFQPRS
jgi:glucose/mannose transport system substrate-binding protein